MKPENRKPGKKFSEADYQAAKTLKRLWYERKETLGLTQKEAAEKLDLTQAAFSNYLNGHTALGFEATMKMAHLFQVSPQLIRPDIMKSWFATPGEFPAKASQGTEGTESQQAAEGAGELVIPPRVSAAEVLSGPGFDYLRDRNPLEAQLANAQEEIRILRSEQEAMARQNESLKLLFADQININTDQKKEIERLKRIIAELKPPK